MTVYTGENEGEDDEFYDDDTEYDDEDEVPGKK